jgi:hypothetical protein
VSKGHARDATVSTVNQYAAYVLFIMAMIDVVTASIATSVGPSSAGIPKTFVA